MDEPKDDDLAKIRRKHRNKKDLEHPDLNRSESGMVIDHFSRKKHEDSVWILRVHGLGVIWMSCSDAPYDDPSGKLRDNGVAIFTEDEIRYGTLQKASLDR